jgi:hypothetical protein
MFRKEIRLMLQKIAKLFFERADHLQSANNVPRSKSSAAQPGALR